MRFKWRSIDGILKAQISQVLPLRVKHHRERIDGDRHATQTLPSSKRRFVSRGPMKNQDIHGSGDLHRSFPGGLYYIGIFWIEFCHLAAFCMLLPRQWNGHKNTLSRNFFRHKPPATSPSISRVRGANVTPVGPLAEHGMT